MKGIAEYIDIVYDKEYLIRKHDDVPGRDSKEYIECGTQSHVLISDPDYYRKWDHLLTQMAAVHMGMCEHGTGFNFNPTVTSGVPPHIDFDEREGNQFNLLLPMFGTAKIAIYETNQHQLESRHGMKHWKMLQDKYPAICIGDILVDKPVLLNTAYLHDVQVAEAPRAIFCVAWRGINKSYNEFKEHVKKTLT